MSNFPINLFHVGEPPSAPTFGVRLGKRKRHTSQKPGELGRAILDSARHCLDYDFILQHPDYKHLLTNIDTGKHEWLDFNLGKDAQVNLFTRGGECRRRVPQGIQPGRLQEGAGQSDAGAVARTAPRVARALDGS